MQRLGNFFREHSIQAKERDGLTNAETVSSEYQEVIREPHRDKLVFIPLPGMPHGKIYLGRQNE